MRQPLRVLPAVVLVAMLGLPTALAAQDAASGDAQHGVQLANMDLSADPRQDFYRYATGG
jgi:hypothetical protein